MLPETKGQPSKDLRLLRAIDRFVVPAGPDLGGDRDTDPGGDLGSDAL